MKFKFELKILGWSNDFKLYGIFVPEDGTPESLFQSMIEYDCHDIYEIDIQSGDRYRGNTVLNVDELISTCIDSNGSIFRINSSFVGAEILREMFERKEKENFVHV